MTTNPQLPKLMPGQGAMNKVMNQLLANSFTGKGLGRSLMTVHAVGRRSGAHYDVPVAYGVDGDDVLFGTPFKWARNLHTGDTVDIHLRGKRVTTTVTAYSSEAEVLAAYDLLCRQRKPFASFNKIGLDASGTPSPDDIRAAWAAGGRAYRLTPVS